MEKWEVSNNFICGVIVYQVFRIIDKQKREPGRQALT